MDLEEKAQFIYHSNQISEITLSLDQTIQVLEGDYDRMETEEIMAPDGETFEVGHVESHLRALNYVLSFPAHKKIDISTIKNLHARLMEGVILSGGEFRECNIRLTGIQPFPYQKIPLAMKQLSQYIDNAFSNPPEDKDLFAWQVHHEFSLFHPFIDGNGRFARLLYNLVRVKFGFQPQVIKSEERSYYLKSIQDFQKYKLRQKG